MKQVLSTNVNVDFSATANTAVYTHTLPRAGTIFTKNIYGVIEELVATGGFSTTAGDFTVSIQEEGGSEVDIAAWSTGVTAVTRAIGFHAPATTDATNAPDGVYNFSAGATLKIKNKAQGGGGTVTGTARVFVPLDFNNL